MCHARIWQSIPVNDIVFPHRVTEGDPAERVVSYIIIAKYMYIDVKVYTCVNTFII